MNVNFNVNLHKKKYVYNTVVHNSAVVGRQTSGSQDVVNERTASKDGITSGAKPVNILPSAPQEFNF